MHECNNHIQHEGFEGLYVVTHEYFFFPYSTCRGVLGDTSKLFFLISIIMTLSFGPPPPLLVLWQK